MHLRSGTNFERHAILQWIQQQQENEAPIMVAGLSIRPEDEFFVNSGLQLEIDQWRRNNQEQEQAQQEQEGQPVDESAREHSALTTANDDDDDDRDDMEDEFDMAYDEIVAIARGICTVAQRLRQSQCVPPPPSPGRHSPMSRRPNPLRFPSTIRSVDTKHYH